MPHEVTTQTKQPEIVVGQYSLPEKLELADLMAKSGVFPDTDTKAKAMAAIMIGESLGMEPGVALMNVTFGAQGLPTISYAWQAGKLRELGWTWEFIEHDEHTCHVQWYPPDDRKPFDTQFSMSQAQAIRVHDKQQKNGASLAGKWNYKSWGPDMLFAFQVRRVVKRNEPQILGGHGGSDEQDAAEEETVGAYQGAPPTMEGGATARDELFPETPDKNKEKGALLRTIADGYQRVIYPMIGSELIREQFCFLLFSAPTWRAVQHVTLANLQKHMDRWLAIIEELETAGLPEGARSWTAEMWSDWILTGSLPLDDSPDEERDPNTTLEPEPEPEPSEDTFLLDVPKLCDQHGIDPIALEAHVRDKYSVEGMADLTQGQRRTVMSWLTNDGGLTYLKRSLGMPTA